MVMLHRMNEVHGNKVLAVAHCNFQLRGSESDEDERFVGTICQNIDVTFHSRSFPTSDYAAEEGLSIQEAARELRYAWFFELMSTHQYSAVATAHHSDDSIETFFINLLRGTGPKGLSGIQEDKERQLIRPLMDMDREDIMAYARSHGIKWREDHSNASMTYLRNAIRHELIPTLQVLRPGFKKVMQRNMAQQKALSSLLDKAVEDYETHYFQKEGESIRISIQRKETDGLILTQALRPYGFTPDQVENILVTTESGKKVLSISHVISTDRGDLVLSPLSETPEGPWSISESLDTSALPFELEVTPLRELPKSLDRDDHVAYLDPEKLQFPVEIRVWKDGDRFRPLGMKGSKLVSDLLTDLKVPLHEKAYTYVLLSGEEIAWVIGRRISDVFKCREGQACLHLRYLP